jgi:hypothetical protein
MTTKNLPTKSLTLENWLLPDSEGLTSIKIIDDGAPRSISSQDWLALCQSAELHLKVPRNVRAYFEAARGALVYGYFFCPLYTLAIEQLFRAAECAVVQKCKETNGRVVDIKGKPIDYYQALAWLRKINFISKEDFHQWDTIRKFRPHPTTHKEPPPAIPPGIVATHLNFVADRINGLFH